MNIKKVEFYRHNLNTEDINECVNVLQSTFLSTGEAVKNFERDFSSYLGIKYAIGVSSCTDALFLSLKGLGISKGDEVITTPLSFIATSNAILYCDATPVFVDVEKNTGNIDSSLIEQAITSKTKAIIPVHLYGQMCDMRKICAIAKKYKLKIIEDAAHCIEGKRDGVRVGQLSDSACFSFYATKAITSGEGGAVATNNKRLADWVMMARLHGMSKNASDRYSGPYQDYDMEILGYKSNMTNIQAALLLNQLRRIDKLRRLREALCKRYNEGFENNPFIKTIDQLPNAIHGHHLYTILVNTKFRSEYLIQLSQKGIGVAVHFNPIHLMKYYRQSFGIKKGTYPNAEKIGYSTISLPCYPLLSSEEQDYVIEIVNKVVVR